MAWYDRKDYSYFNDKNDCHKNGGVALSECYDCNFDLSAVENLNQSQALMDHRLHMDTGTLF